MKKKKKRERFFLSGEKEVKEKGKRKEEKIRTFFFK